MSRDGPKKKPDEAANQSQAEKQKSDDIASDPHDTPDPAVGQQALTRKEVRGMLAGAPPTASDLAAYGPYAETVQELQRAFDQGGTEAVRRVFSTLAENWPELAKLAAADPVPRKTRWTADELLNTDFPEPTWTVPNIVPTGLISLAGRPKVGKSWLSLQISGAVGTGGTVLDQKVIHGKVLYLALEDGPRRLRERLDRQQIPASAAVTFITEWKPLSDGGLAELQAEIESGGYSLVVIDTLSRAIGRADQMDLAEMTVILGNLQQMAHIYGMTILLVDHHRKNTGALSDPIDDIVGSTAKAAVVDAALGLYKEKGKHTASLKVVGRDLEERDLALEWDSEYCIWKLLGEASTIRRSAVRDAIRDAIRDLVRMGEIPSTTRIARHLGKNTGNVSREIAVLLDAGVVVKGKKTGREQPYILPSMSLKDTQ